MTLFSQLQHQIDATPAIEAPAEGELALAADTNEVQVYRIADGGWYYLLKTGNPPAGLKVSADYQTLERVPGVQTEGSIDRSRFLLRTAFECRFTHEGVVSLHGACVQKDGFAVVFTGRSGAGKSTRANAWIEGLGAQFISGDRPAVRLEADGSTTACGVPWDGKEQIFSDVEVPLKCILDVRRSPANYIRQLSQREAQTLLAQQGFIPMWDTDAAAMALFNVRRLAKSVPVLRVFCGMHAEDARVIYDILMNHPELIKPATEEEETMQIKNGFTLRNVLDEHMVMPTGDNIGKFEGTVVLNDVSAFVFEQLKMPVSRDDILEAILAEYDVDAETAAKDLDALLAQFRELGMIED
jgi:hypothetical protein